MNGFIKLHRSMLEWEWYTDPITMRVFIHLLLNASFKESRFMGMEVHPGQVITGRKALAEQLEISERQVRTALKRLKSTNEVTIKTTSKFSVVTIEKWGVYQGVESKNDQVNDQVSDQQVTSKRPASDQQVTTSKEGKEVKEGQDYLFKRTEPRTRSDLGKLSTEERIARNKALSAQILADIEKGIY